MSAATDLRLHEVTLGEWGRYAIVLPARSPQDAVTVASLLNAAFDLTPFYETEKTPAPPVAPHKEPILRDPERLVGHLSALYERMLLAGPDRRVFAREFDIVESQIDYLRLAPPRPGQSARERISTAGAPHSKTS
jgi:hypothetical protein